MSRPKVMAYYFPNWHEDERNAAWFGPGWTEWELVRGMRPVFPGHRPLVPADGFTDESDPSNMARDIELASTHGVDGFLFDYYWYDDGPYLSGAVDRGYLQAPNRAAAEFALMWANHDLVDVFPADGSDVRRLKAGGIDAAAFERMTDHVIREYFSVPSYLKIDGRPFFSIYEIATFIQGIGGREAARDALRRFESKTRAAGFPGLHLDCVVWGFGVLPTAAAAGEAPGSLILDLDFRSASSYVWVHHLDLQAAGFPRGDWNVVRRHALSAYEKYLSDLPVPFIPNVTVGWDSSPRTRAGLAYEPRGYPWFPIFETGPAEFRAGLEATLELIDRTGSRPPLLTINAWNEWSEGSALLPSTRHGHGHLEAIRDVMG